ncbi:endonuclease/exonuclease/phosphatase family protein [Chitinophaga nivalis]|uniref:Endonuclease/exonuclease/phosphatase family protein n=1 Tax=Chitinophaga nivalis TaxID=2991709 RepID=A0ABT3IEW0_9BACT|nr:endonuclease/exonuclease/phosphatase family protein [Chitinophaga nivalis]MCW3467959.1 endonuclease/exonuclease/phosphatase family protein [Chitinophaga nivalis]MCW3482350.1 endonuclease/exonuclease/phosphatase family protein [Chitinophaga nivalis]
MKKLYVLLATALLPVVSFAQTAVYKQSFDKDTGYVTCAGIRGTALNLGPEVATRKVVTRPYVLNKYDGAYTVICWVKAQPSRQGYVLLQAVSGTEEAAAGWSLGVQENGAWYWKIKQQKGTYQYMPTPERQNIRDNKWHQLAYSYNDVKEECALYYDGQQVAIYYTAGIKGAQQAEILAAGGAIQGDLGEWATFNGALDEIALYKTILSPDDISNDYTKYVAGKKKTPQLPAGAPLKVMNYNIWHGGNETGKEVGPQRIAAVIRASGADVITMQETYGSGERIADALGYYFYLRSTNLSIMSRYPIAETLRGAHAFCNGGVFIQLDATRRVAVVNNWLSYPFDYWDMLEKKQPIGVDTLVTRMEEHNGAQLRKNLDAIDKVIAHADEIPVIFSGDFNSGSHLDWTPATRHLNEGLVVPFPQSNIMQEAGFTDSYRQLHPDPLKDRGITWSPQFPHAFKDRIDYIYYKGKKLQPLTSVTISTHPVHYPSDHAALMTSFRVQ